ncbi:hypothetical protein VC0101557_26090 [Vibrio cholerae VC0101557]|nr:hypothetical protein VCHC49A2_2892 [Vibrio cholerae HC-49A2]EGS47442.1 hypothetical protein VCHC70A1_2023 [Vibrio cholerae HC-70A1]EGS47523.1 hypothetical protein VCHC48A1_1957 [Vibrio cholerae HC-48A1]EGS62219.1 hypothetical protein VCHFU02_2181 [Vibrio cholerae HFU-02]EGS70406.1 hypothetical protein VCHC38A1_1908 [Vibrio cholerae HC-38A1]EHH71184.1 hypothetical protein VCHC06A1_2191 [Vibrio cholerae HC-06A1]EHH72038.1 hypothetical protein VCHC21A1_1854 [Vibrio cholerae HC-21A1]EHH76476.
MANRVQSISIIDHSELFDVGAANKLAQFVLLMSFYAD